jgi:hypothetical protein
MITWIFIDTRHRNWLRTQRCESSLLTDYVCCQHIDTANNLALSGWTANLVLAQAWMCYCLCFKCSCILVWKKNGPKFDQFNWPIVSLDNWSTQFHKLIDQWYIVVCAVEPVMVSVILTKCVSQYCKNYLVQFVAKSSAQCFIEWPNFPLTECLPTS